MNSSHRIHNNVCRICATVFLCAVAGVAVLDATQAWAGSTAVSSRDNAMVNASEAARRLAQAQLERTQGAKPLPGEMAQGSGASAGDHHYRQRQEKLLHVVEQAQRRFDKTHLSLRTRQFNSSSLNVAGLSRSSADDEP